MNVILISTYDLGHQPFGLASPAAWLKRIGASVKCFDLTVQKLEAPLIKKACLIGFFLPMHTATRQAIKIIQLVKQLNSKAHLCAYGLYAPLNKEFLSELGIQTFFGGEFEEGLLQLANVIKLNPSQLDRVKINQPPYISVARQEFFKPDRTTLPSLRSYAHLLTAGSKKVSGYTEASRGCQHQCKHCPIVPVYQGKFRIVQKEVVLQDIQQQINAGAEHITFGDPDFFNGVKHSLEIVRDLNRRYPQVSYDVTIKIEHLLRYASHLQNLKETGCLFITSAVESLDDHVLKLLNKGHTRNDFLKAVELLSELQLPLNPTFIPFTPWTSWKNYCELLDILLEKGLMESVSPIQLAIRLLIPLKSPLLELTDIQKAVKSFDKKKLSYSWRHPDLRIERLYRQIQQQVSQGNSQGLSRSQIFASIWTLAHSNNPSEQHNSVTFPVQPSRTTIPFLEEPWYC